VVDEARSFLVGAIFALIRGLLLLKRFARHDPLLLNRGLA
jgi:hypothetical protein